MNNDIKILHISEFFCHFDKSNTWNMLLRQVKCHEARIFISFLTHNQYIAIYDSLELLKGDGHTTTSITRNNMVSFLSKYDYLFDKTYHPADINRNSVRQNAILYYKLIDKQDIRIRNIINKALTKHLKAKKSLLDTFSSLRTINNIAHITSDNNRAGILHLLAKQPLATNTHIARTLNINANTVHNQILKLVEYGYLTYIQTHPDTRPLPTITTKGQKKIQFYQT